MNAMYVMMSVLCHDKHLIDETAYIHHSFLLFCFVIERPEHLQQFASIESLGDLNQKTHIT